MGSRGERHKGKGWSPADSDGLAWDGGAERSLDWRYVEHSCWLGWGESRGGVAGAPTFLECTAGWMVETFTEAIAQEQGEHTWRKMKDEGFVGHPEGDGKDVRIIVVPAR